MSEAQRCQFLTTSLGDVGLYLICHDFLLVVCNCDHYECFQFQDVQQFFKASFLFSVFMVCLTLFPLVDVILTFSNF